MRPIGARVSLPATSLLAVALCAALALGLTSCSQSDQGRRDAYCEKVDDASGDLTRITDEGGTGAFVTALPILEKLGAASPGDLKDEWQVFLNALRGLASALQEADLDPDAVDNGLPQDLSGKARRKITGAASVLATDEVRAASAGIEQHALDICGTPLL